MTTTAENITAQQLTDLRAEALSANDHAMAAICELARDGSVDLDEWGTLSAGERDRVAALDASDARAECARVIAAAEAQQ